MSDALTCPRLLEWLPQEEPPWL